MVNIAKFILDGSTCRHCAQIIKKHFSEMPGVQGIEMDFVQGLVTIEYQSEILQPSRFEEAFRELGYSCSGEYVRKIDSCC